MSRLPIPALPRASGTYAWLYADVTAGPYTAVAIFLLGSAFSPRYAARLRRGARPLDHCAVNFALYRDGRSLAWVFSEYAGAEADERSLRIGNSVLAYGADGTLEMRIADHTAPWGRPLEARLALVPQCPPAPTVQLDATGRHVWQAVSARCDARLEAPALGVAASGHGYHDANRGDAPLGAEVASWRWARIHGPDATRVCYRPAGDGPAVHVLAATGDARLWRAAAPPLATRRSGWGLEVPLEIATCGVVLPAGPLLESSPFYARQEARAPDLHGLAEVADFRRFRSPLIRWMAHFRMRVEAA